MKTETISGMTVLTPDDGMILKSGYVYSEKVYLGKLDSVDNWTEVPETDPREEEPEQEEQDEEDQTDSKTTAQTLIDIITGNA